ncbi:MAG: hypothetical protein KAI27_08010 [Rhodospirillaceae bacterium]|nr:hypothetical protein [Rhodospirillaceae bacterium]
MIATCSAYCKNPKLLQILSVIALVFGVATIFSGGQVIFGPEEKRVAAGAYVPFVVWFNFISGFAYVTAAIGLFRRAKWGAYLAIAIAASTAVTFAAFGAHVFMDGAFEARTVGAMILRTGVWIVIACVAQQARAAGNADVS